MQPIHPICHETISPLVGRRVCAITVDGTHYYGTVGEVRDGRCYLTDCNVGKGALSLSALKTSGSKKKTASTKKAKLSGLYGGYGYDGYGYGSYWLDFALIATLFLLPFFFFF